MKRYDIINNENIFTNEQLRKYIELLGEKYSPNHIIICETKDDVLEYSNGPHLELDAPLLAEILSGEIEGLYTPSKQTICVFVFSEDDDGDDLQSKQLYSLHALTHELRLKYQIDKRINLNGKIAEEVADEFATNFVNTNSQKISEIMHWDEEWQISEDD